jgi:hypothetical protein
MAREEHGGRSHRRLLIVLAAALAAGFVAGARVDDGEKKHIMDRLTEIRRMPGRLLT